MNRDMMAQLGQMQERLMKAQEEMDSRVVEGTAGGGAVKVSITGAMKVQSLKIEPEVVDPDDVSMLEDLIIAAMNEALQQVQNLQAGQLSGLTGGLNIPGLGGMLGLGGLGGGAGGPGATGGAGAPGGAPPPMNRAARRGKK